MHNPGSAQPQSTPTFAVSLNRNPPEQVHAPSAFDAVIASMEEGIGRCEAVLVDLHYDHLKRTGEMQRRRDEDAMRQERAVWRFR